MCGAQSLCSAIEDMRPEFAYSLSVQVGDTSFLDVIVDRSMEPFCRVSGGCCPEECHHHSANKLWDSVH